MSSDNDIQMPSADQMRLIGESIGMAISASGGWDVLETLLGDMVAVHAMKVQLQQSNNPPDYMARRAFDAAEAFIGERRRRDASKHPAQYSIPGA